MPIREERPSECVLAWKLSEPRRRNAVAPEDLEWIARRCATLRDEIVILRGDGDGPFCSGFDLRRLRQAARPDLPLVRATAAMERASATFVAAVAGYAIGAGVELCAACDFVCAEQEAFFAVPAGRLGVLYHREGLGRLVRRFGTAAVRTMVLLGRRVPAESLAATGAVDVLAPAGGLDGAVADLVADLSNTPPSVRAPVVRYLRGAGAHPELAPESWTQRRGALYAAARRPAAMLRRP